MTAHTMHLITNIIVYIMISINALAWGAVALVWGLIGIAKYKGWNDPHITPAMIIERLCAKCS